MEGEDLMPKISVCFSKILERKGYSRHNIEAMASQVRLREYIEHKQNDSRMLYNVGSNAEGVDISGSDRDVMMVMPICTIVADAGNLQRNRNQNVFLIQQEGVRPCYTKLQLLESSIEDGETFKDLFCTMTSDDENNFFFSSEKFARHRTLFVSDTCDTFVTANHTLSDFHLHGPCAAFDNSVGPTKFSTDCAFCLPYNNIPTEALNFISRPKNYDWPPLKIIDSLREHGCHIAPIGDKLSETSSIEWRMSYVLTERELVWSFNDIQCKCYVILKMILNELINTVESDVLSSYMLKTVMFWCAEKEPPSIWKEENLLLCFKRCLFTLYNYMAHKNLPHYVVPENNLLLEKSRNTEAFRKVQNVVKRILDWKWYDYLTLKAFSKISKAWEEHKDDVPGFLRLIRPPNMMSTFYRDLAFFRALQTLYIDINSYSDTNFEIQGLLKHVQNIPEEYKVGSSKDFVEFAENVLKFNLIRRRNNRNSKDNLSENFIASSCEHKLFKNKPLNTKDEFEIIYQRNRTKEYGKIEFSDCNDSYNLSLMAESPDVCTGLMNIAIQYLIRKDYTKAEDTIKKVLSSIDVHVLYIGLCGEEEIEMFEYMCYINTAEGPLSIVQKVKTCLSFDYVISRYDDILPIFKMHQSLWEEDVVPICIHPIIFVYYLFFLTVFSQGKLDHAEGYMNQLELHVYVNCKPRPYLFIALNLLGHCYFLMKKYRKAKKTFNRSISAKPTYNPALFYVGHC